VIDIQKCYQDLEKEYCNFHEKRNNMKGSTQFGYSQPRSAWAPETGIHLQERVHVAESPRRDIPNRTGPRHKTEIFSDIWAQIVNICRDKRTWDIFLYLVYLVLVSWGKSKAGKLMSSSGKQNSVNEKNEP
jgi:hypothetical protein